ncbi:hypothetical protein VE00_02295 [Pseudogymnoascus sp. WSF 3629]|nr:hypothetical protein VE00_02295 [Pseudogymnoascus sp. WSF 3629]
MAPKTNDGDVLLAFSGKWVTWAHTFTAYAAFISALIVGVSLHYHKIVKNEHYGYPQEWFPSVSATIGDRYPERSFFMFFIAITSGPRFALVGLWYLLTARPGQKLAKYVAIVGVFRTITCGGWTYVTSTDDHDWHDIFMISYLVATLPWTLGCLALSPPNPTTIKYRKIFGGTFFATIVPLVYFFIQHKVHKVAGAYTKYAFFEWSLVLLDVAFDAVTMLDFDAFEVVIKDVTGASKGQPRKDSGVEMHKDKPVVQVLNQSFLWSDAIDAAAEVYHGFVFWSMLTSLGLCVWYFPLWNMGISGYEILVMVTVTPFLLSNRSIRRLVLSNLRLTHLLSLSGLVAYKLELPELRLFAVGLGVALSCLAWSATWSTTAFQPVQLETKITAWTLGLILHSVVKFAWQTSNPIWPIVHDSNGGYNFTGLVLAVLAVLRTTSNGNKGTSSPVERKQQGSSVLAAFGIGGLFFALHSLLSDSSTMILWVWTGFPVRGPLAAPHGAVTIAAMCGGLVLGLFYPLLARSWTFYGLGCVGAALLTARGDWTGYSGALLLTVYLLAFSVPMIGAAAKRNPATVFGLGFLVYNFVVLFHVWVVAYAFVPGGPLVRERTDWVMSTTMLLIGCGVFTISSPTGAKSTSYTPPAPRQRAHTLSLVGIIQLAALCVAYIRFPTFDYTPYHAPSKLITAGIWTVHFSLDNDMWSSEYRMRDALRDLELDVVGLLESDLQRVIMGNRDTTQFLAEELGMYVDYGPGPDKHTWGAALLSKFPIVESEHHLLPSPVGELAPAIKATLDVYGTLVDVFVFHSGQEEDEEDRRLQSEYLAELMGKSDRPAILLAYLVTKPLEGNYNTYVSEKSGMKDIDESDWDRWCEYILYKNLRRIGYARVSRGTITDTEIQVGKFLVGKKEGGGWEGRGGWAGGERAGAGEVQRGWKFPGTFEGEGVRGHRYHVFEEPRYWV